MKCPSCKHKEKKGAKYCTRCGRPLKSGSDPTFYKTFALFSVISFALTVIITAGLLMAGVGIIVRSQNYTDGITGELDAKTSDDGGQYERGSVPSVTERSFSPEGMESEAPVSSNASRASETPFENVTEAPEDRETMSGGSEDMYPVDKLIQFIRSAVPEYALDAFPPGTVEGIFSKFGVLSALLSEDALYSAFRDRLLTRIGVDEASAAYIETELFGRRELEGAELEELISSFAEEMISYGNGLDIDSVRELEIGLAFPDEEGWSLKRIAVDVIHAGDRWYLDPRLIPGE